MSWDISLTDMVTGEVLHSDSPHMMRGGTFMLGGTTEQLLSAIKEETESAPGLVSENFLNEYVSKLQIEQNGSITVTFMNGSVVSSDIEVKSSVNAAKKIITRIEADPKKKAANAELSILRTAAYGCLQKVGDGNIRR